jgi:hypothetical protein
LERRKQLGLSSWKAADGDLDAGLLMWDMRRSVDAQVLPLRRLVVQFEYPDAPPGGRDWWLVAGVR